MFRHDCSGPSGKIEIFDLTTFICVPAHLSLSFPTYPFPCPPFLQTFVPAPIGLAKMALPFTMTVSSALRTIV